VENCEVCLTTDIGKCQECSANHELNSDQTQCTPCAFNQFFNTSSEKCEVCGDDCSRCQNGDGECSQCQPGNFQIDPDDPKSCLLLDCPDGQVLVGNFCRDCERLCSTCSSLSTCTACIPGYFLDESDGSCFRICEESQFLIFDRNECFDCEEHCIECENDSGKCTKCHPEFTLGDQNKCIEIINTELKVTQKMFSKSSQKVQVIFNQNIEIPNFPELSFILILPDQENIIELEPTEIKLNDQSDTLEASFDFQQISNKTIDNGVIQITAPTNRKAIILISDPAINFNNYPISINDINFFFKA
jgi:hypothetical protein